MIKDCQLGTEAVKLPVGLGRLLADKAGSVVVVRSCQPRLVSIDGCCGRLLARLVWSLS